ncbi:MAG: putative integral rane protein [Actinomycetia bacterium]|nr:putative integral rane protein [Actinomycetes bacterium]
MPDATPSSSRAESRRTHGEVGRLVAFSDGVLAVAATLTAFQFKIPSNLRSDAAFSHQLHRALETVPLFLLSFFLIGMFWQLHHRAFDLIARQNAVLRWLNLGFLAVVCFLPFSTKVLADYSGGAYLTTDGSSFARRAVILYGTTVLIAALALALMWVYAARWGRLLRRDTTKAQVRRESIRAVVTPVVFVLSIVLAIVVHPTFGALFWLAVPLALAGVALVFRAEERREEVSAVVRSGPQVGD